MALTDNLIAWWDGENARDSHENGHDLTENGAVTYVPGKVGNCFQPSESGNKYWSIANADASAFDFGTKDMTFAFWIEQLDHGGNEVIFQYGAASTTVDGITIWSNGNDKIIVYVSDGTTRVGKQFNAAMSGGAWYCLVLELDRSGNMTLYVNDVAVGSADISAMSASDIQPETDLYIGSDGVNELDNKLDSVAVWDRLLGSTDRTAYYNSGDGLDAETEIERDYNFTGSTAKRVKVQAKAAEIGGSGTHTSQLLYITEGQLPDELHDTDETATVEATGAPSLRISTSESGAGQVPLYTYKFVPASGGGDAKIYFNSGNADMDGTSGTDVYLWWFPSGSEKFTHPVDSAFGANSVVQSNPMLAVLGGDYVDFTTNGNTAGTTTAPTTASSQLGDTSYDFDGSGDRITFPDDNSLDADTMVSFALWVKFDNVDTGTWQSIFSKRQGFDVNYGLHFNPTDNSMQLYFYQSSDWRSLHIDLRTYVGDTNWHHIAGKLVENGSDVDTQLWVDGVSAGSSTISSITLPANTRELNFGISKTGASSYGDEFEGQIDSPIFFNYDISSDEVLTLYNNQNDPATFWDTTFAVTSPGVTGQVSTYHGAANITVQHKLGLSAILAYESSFSNSLTNKLGLKARATHESGAAGSLTHTLGLAASVVASHNAGATFSTQHKTGRVSIVAVQEGINVSGTDVFGRVAVVNHQGDISFSNIHITGRQARSNHEIGAVYSALTVEINDPVNLSLSIEHLNKITLTIEKVS